MWKIMLNDLKPALMGLWIIISVMVVGFGVAEGLPIILAILFGLPVDQTTAVIDVTFMGGGAIILLWRWIASVKDRAD